jgi:hypothetical protein
MGVGGQLHAPAPSSSGTKPSTHGTGILLCYGKGNLIKIKKFAEKKCICVKVYQILRIMIK